MLPSPQRPLVWIGLLPIVLSGCFVSDDKLQAALDADDDGVMFDEDCDDNNADVKFEVEWYADVDGDGFGAGDLQTGCPSTRPTTNTSDNADDCDDSNPSAFPGAEERYYDGIDQDCAGADADGNGSIDDFDQDGDGWEQDQDCDDTDASLRPDPSLTEIYYDGIENDCDLTTGDGDKDGDGYWSADYATKAAGSTLSSPDGLGGDCFDDVDNPEQDVSPLNGLTAPAPADVYPGAPEDAPYDGIDGDCGGNDYEFDNDQDGYASAAYANRDDETGGDCQDCATACDAEDSWTNLVASEDIHPDAEEEYYDGVDQDCLGEDSDENGAPDDFDRDSDGHSAIGFTQMNGDPGGDCLDDDRSVHPGVTDTWYDGVDSDCGGEDDYDADLDGFIHDDDFGKPTAGIADWAQLPGGDCVDDPINDGGAGRQDADDYNPDATDVWYDGLDHNCDNKDDFDADDDRYRVEGLSTSLATYHQYDVLYADGSRPATDCDDTQATVNPGLSEVASNDTDDNCDGAAAPEGIQGVNHPADHAEGGVVGTGELPGFGYTMAVGDVNGDGVADVVAGSNSYSGVYTTGGAFAVYDGADMYGSKLDDKDYMALFEGVNTGLRFGDAVLVADVDDDGFEDVIVSEPYYENTATTGSSDGGVYVYFGPLSGSTSSPLSGTNHDADLFLEGGSSAGLGRALGAHDYDLDGIAELMAGGMYADYSSGGVALANTGAVYFFDADTTGTLEDSNARVVYGSDASEYLGSNYGSAGGDFDGNGYADIALGAFYSSAVASYGGRVYLIDTPFTDGSVAEDIADLEVYGSSSYAYCGRNLAMGDLDDDGYDDLVVGCNGYNSGYGAVVVQYGSSSASGNVVPSTADVRIQGEYTANAERFGYTVAVEDVTGDGVADLLAGGYQYSPDAATLAAGRVALFEGSSTSMSGTYSAGDAQGFIEGDTETGYLGYSIAPTGDFDGDSIHDILVSRIGTNIDGTTDGDMVLFLGGHW